MVDHNADAQLLGQLVRRLSRKSAPEVMVSEMVAASTTTKKYSAISEMSDATLRRRLDLAEARRYIRRAKGARPHAWVPGSKS